MTVTSTLTSRRFPSLSVICRFLPATLPMNGLLSLRQTGFFSSISCPSVLVQFTVASFTACSPARMMLTRGGWMGDTGHKSWLFDHQLVPMSAACG